MTLQHEPHETTAAPGAPPALPPLPPLPPLQHTLADSPTEPTAATSPAPPSPPAELGAGPGLDASSLLAVRRPATALAMALRAAAMPASDDPATSRGLVRLPLPPLPGPRLGGCSDLVEIDRGSGTVVYRAWHHDLQRLVQLTILTAPALDDRRFVEFLNRRPIISTLSWHPHIQPLHDAGLLDGGGGYLVSEYLPFGSLGGRIASAGALPWSEVVHYGVQIADALDAAHRAEVSHGGLHPHLLRLDRTGSLKLAGLGLGAAVFGRRMGLDGHPTRPGDLADLGVTLWTLLSGGTAAMIAASDEGGGTLSLDIPSRLLDLIERLIAVRPVDETGAAPVEAAWLWGVAGPTAAAAAKELQRIEFELDLDVTPTYTGGHGAPTASDAIDEGRWTASVDTAPGLQSWGGWTPTNELIWTSGAETETGPETGTGTDAAAGAAGAPPEAPAPGPAEVAAPAETTTPASEATAPTESAAPPSAPAADASSPGVEVAAPDAAPVPALAPPEPARDPFGENGTSTFGPIVIGPQTEFGLSTPEPLPIETLPAAWTSPSAAQATAEALEAAPATVPETHRRRMTRNIVAVALAVAAVPLAFVLTDLIRGGNEPQTRPETTIATAPGSGASATATVEATTPPSAPPGNTPRSAGTTTAAPTATTPEPTGPVVLPAAAVSTIEVGQQPALLRTGDGALWLANLGDRTVSRIDPTTSAVITSDRLSGDIAGLATGGGFTWVSLTNGGLVRLDAATDAVDRRFSLTGGPQTMEVLDGRLWWVHNRDLTALSADDIGGGRRRIQIGDGFTRLAADPGRGVIWTLNPGTGTLLRVAVPADQVDGRLELGGRPTALVVDGDGVWIVDSDAATIVRIDPFLLTIVETIRIDGTPVAIRPSADGLWVGLADGAGLQRLSTGPGREVTATAPGGGMAAGSQLELTGSILWWNDFAGRRVIRLDLSGASPSSASPGDGAGAGSSGSRSASTTTATTLTSAGVGQGSPAGSGATVNRPGSAPGAPGTVVTDLPAASTDALSPGTAPHVDSPSPPLPPEPTEAPTPTPPEPTEAPTPPP